MSMNDVKKLSIEELEAQVRQHNRLYFVENRPEISDYDFDRLVEELRERKPHSKVLSELTSDVPASAKKVNHDIPMLSLDKCYDEKVLQDWAAKFEGDVVASPKIDGCAVSLRYDQNGDLFLAATRGDGAEGEEITANVSYVMSIPKKIKKGGLEVRGEVYMPLSIFKSYKGKFANPRNLTAGAIKLKDPKGTGDYRLSFFAYDLFGSTEATEVEKYKLLKSLGFEVVKWRELKRNEMQDAFNDFLKMRDDFDYELDGVVFRTNLLAEQDRLGSTAHHPRYAIAYKFQGDSGETILLDVEWSVSRTGAITPVAIVEPVELSGAIVRRASLHNVGIVKKLGLSKGAKVLMMRRGGVIPNLESVIEQGSEAIKIPKRCPSCDSDIRVEDDFLYCTNSKSCVKSKVGELAHFVKAVGIDGFGEKLLAKLYEEGLVTDLSELYDLTRDDLIGLERMGDTLADKLLSNVDASKQVSLPTFLQSLGIRELGKHASKILSSFGSLTKVMSLSEDELSEINTIGPVIAREVVAGLKDKNSLIDKLLKHVAVVEERNVSTSWHYAGKSFLFTGKLLSMGRGDAQKSTESLGGTTAQSVTKGLDYLVVGDGGGAGSKLEKVKKLQSGGSKVQIIAEKDFLEMIKES
ncbi:MAG: NAD-dependent DNA ligase LigA [Deltaproteobacteria bacterium]|jgi:DNA ligase (NAD+)|nr:NAD-dependent DNA ligase LigA [Deltaproteobacteria bacterium]